MTVFLTRSFWRLVSLGEGEETEITALTMVDCGKMERDARLIGRHMRLFRIFALSMPPPWSVVVS